MPVASPFWAVDRAGDAPDVVVCFSAMKTRPGSFMMRKLLTPFPAQRVYLNCPDNQWYLDGVPGLGDSPEATADSLSTLIEGLRGPGGRVLFFGGSMGGYGAVDQGLRCGADLVLATGVELVLNLPGGLSRPQLRGRDAAQPLAPRLAGARGAITLMCGEDCPADLYGAGVAAPFLTATSRIVTFAARGHRLPPWLARRYGFDALFAALLRDRPLPLDPDSLGDLMAAPQLVPAIYAAQVPAAREVLPDLPAHPGRLLEQALAGPDLTANQRAAAAQALAALRLRQGRPDQALEAAQAGIAASDRSARLRNLAARAARQCGQPEAARRHLDRMIALSRPELGTNDPEVLQTLLRLCLDQGEIAPGLALALRHLPTEPDDPHLWKLYEALLTRHLQQVRQDPAAARAALAALQAP